MFPGNFTSPILHHLGHRVHDSPIEKHDLGPGRDGTGMLHLDKVERNVGPRVSHWIEQIRASSSAGRKEGAGCGRRNHG